MSGEDTKTEKKQEINRIFVLWFIYLHLLGIYGTWLLFTSAKWLTLVYLFSLTWFSSLGLTAGAHRLWAHQTYTASHTVKLLLMLAHTLAGVGPIYGWVLKHRLHHKFYGTDKDPYNHKKGFWYSHVMGNLMLDLPDKERTDKEIDMRDVDDDLYVRIQKTFYYVLFIIFGILIPINTATTYWNESLVNTIFILCFLRLALTMNISALVNSGLLIWALREGEKYPPNDNSVFFVRKTLWPHYHYMVPWDWKTGEFGRYEEDSATSFIKICNVLGFVKQLKTTTSEDIREALYQVASKKASLKDSMDNLKKISEVNAIKGELRRRC